VIERNRYSFEDFGAHYVNQDDPDMNGEQCETSCQLQLSMYTHSHSLWLSNLHELLA
jgi:hypothetical protein